MNGKKSKFQRISLKEDVSISKQTSASRAKWKEVSEQKRVRHLNVVETARMCVLTVQHLPGGVIVAPINLYLFFCR